MTTKLDQLTHLPEWQALITHQQVIAPIHMRQWFSQDPERFTRYSIANSGLLLDYSRHRIDQESIQLLCKLANSARLKDKINSLFSGLPINRTENRAVLHTALRDKQLTPIYINGHNIAKDISACLTKMRQFTQQLHTHAWLGSTGKPIAHIVNIGIGGSHLGPQTTCHALKESAVSSLQFHFVSSIDKSLLNDVLQQIDPETTLFIISSKTFGTLETLTNAQTLRRYMQDRLGQAAIQQHFIAVTANKQAAVNFGIPENNIFPIWEWVNGRYSIWSAIGLPLMLMIGTKGFDEFLAGAYAIDQHFCTTDFARNMPVLLGLLGIWYQNFFNTQIHAVIPYSYRLRYLIPYLQQAEMESNGKSMNLDGEQINYATGSVIFGEEGTNGQHSYHQLLHQGQHLIPADFILIGKPATLGQEEHDDILLSSGISQAQALMRGKTLTEAHAELLALHYPAEEAAYLAPHKVIPGNRPSSVIFLERLTPRNLGALLAMYEHKIFVQGAIWGINSFDQWGVELGKQLLPAILERIHGKQPEGTVDSATLGLINHFRQLREET